MILLLALIIICFGSMTLSWKYFKSMGVAANTAVLMVLLPIHSSILVEYPWLGVSNVTNIFYATILHGWILVASHCKIKQAIHIFWTLLITMGLGVFISQIMGEIAGNDVPSRSINAQSAIASFISFSAVGLWILILQKCWYNNYLRASIIAQIIDSILFFSIAFIGTTKDTGEIWTIDEIFHIAWIGAIIKCCMHIFVGYPLIRLFPEKNNYQTSSKDL